MLSISSSSLLLPIKSDAGDKLRGSHRLRLRQLHPLVSPARRSPHWRMAVRLNATGGPLRDPMPGPETPPTVASEREVGVRPEGGTRSS
jgi:hypothetical protein